MTPTELLTRVSGIRMKHELVAELTGENFNVFSILGLKTAETRTHSAFLCELLDPKGTHGMGDAFLRAFIRMLRGKFSKNKAFSGCKAFNTEPLIEEQALAAKVVPELHVGYKSADLTQGGKIDLAIIPDSGRWKILIENKIRAGDQECQLVRYRNSDKAALLIYLTLDGKEASDDSLINRVTNEKLIAGIDYVRVSYASDILAWLEACAKESAARPLVRETIVQYSHLIKELTHQNSSNLMTQEITNTVLSSKDALLSFKVIQNSDWGIKVAIINELKARLSKLAHGLSLEFEANFDATGAKDTGFYFWSPAWQPSGTNIAFAASYSWLNEWYYGIGAPGNNPVEFPLSAESINDLNHRFNELFFSKEKPNEWLVACTRWTKYVNWSEPETLASVYFGSFVDDVKSIILATLEIARASGLPGDYSALSTPDRQ